MSSGAQGPARQQNSYSSWALAGIGILGSGPVGALVDLAMAGFLRGDKEWGYRKIIRPADGDLANRAAPLRPPGPGPLLWIRTGGAEG